VTAWEIIAEKAKELPPEKQLEALHFIEALRTRAQRKGSLRSPAGLLKNLGIDLSEEGITEARRALWSTFRRKDV
jgi:Protein of unknown function (DUF2281)